MRRRRRRKQRKIIIISSLTLLLIMTVGYAAFQTNINITAKGNILEKGITINELKNKVTTSGDGLYKDTYETNRYIYRGANPDNYITFNNELWRIISIENDNTLKIIRNESIGNMPYDTDNRYQENGYCSHEYNKTHGCNVWGSKTTMLDTNGNNITKLMPFNEQMERILPEKEGTLNTYLNTEYYNNLSNDKEKIVIHRWNVGQIMLTTNQTLETDISQEKANKWDGKVALINGSDYLKASLNSECKGLYFSRVSPYPCKDINWLLRTSWTISSGYFQHSQWNIANKSSGALGHSFTNGEAGIYPTLHLNSNIILTGKGTETKPYVIH